MFARRYFAGRFFAPVFFPQSQGEAPDSGGTGPTYFYAESLPTDMDAAPEFDHVEFA